MKEKLRKFDEEFARGEAAMATVVLLALVVVAGLQTFFRKFSDVGQAWASDALHSMEWGDAFMERATLWLAMLGASLAAHHDKHIAIDILQKIATPIVRAILRGTVQLFAGLTSFYFARVVLAALISKANRIPTDYGVFDDMGDTVHICDAAANQIPDDMAVSSFFCAIRGGLESAGVVVNSPERAMDLVVPAMFAVIAVRFIIKGIASLMTIPDGGIHEEEEEAVAPLAGDEGDADDGADDAHESEEDESADHLEGDDAADEDDEDSASEDASSKEEEE